MATPNTTLFGGLGRPIVTSDAQGMRVVVSGASSSDIPPQGTPQEPQKIKVPIVQPTVGGVKPPQFSDVLPQVQTRPDGSQFIQLPASINPIQPTVDVFSDAQGGQYIVAPDQTQVPLSYVQSAQGWLAVQGYFGMSQGAAGGPIQPTGQAAPTQAFRNQSEYESFLRSQGYKGDLAGLWTAYQVSKTLPEVPIGTPAAKAQAILQARPIPKVVAGADLSLITPGVMKAYGVAPSAGEAGKGIVANIIAYGTKPYTVTPEITNVIDQVNQGIQRAIIYTQAGQPTPGTVAIPIVGNRVKVYAETGKIVDIPLDDFKSWGDLIKGKSPNLGELRARLMDEGIISPTTSIVNIGGQRVEFPAYMVPHKVVTYPGAAVKVLSVEHLPDGTNIAILETGERIPVGKGIEAGSSLSQQDVKSYKEAVTKEAVAIDKEALSEFEASLKTQPKEWQDAYARGRVKAYEEAVAKSKANFEANLPNLPKILQDAYNGGKTDKEKVDSFNSALKQVQADYDIIPKDYKEIDPITGKVTGNVFVQKYIEDNWQDPNLLVKAGVLKDAGVLDKAKVDIVEFRSQQSALVGNVLPYASNYQDLLNDPTGDLKPVFNEVGLIKYLVANPNDTKTLLDYGFLKTDTGYHDDKGIPHTVHGVDTLNKLATDLRNQVENINKGINEGTLSQAELIALTDAIRITGAKDLSAWDIALHPAPLWNSLSKQQQVDVASAYVADKYKGNLFSEMAKVKQEVFAGLPDYVTIPVAVGEMATAVFLPIVGIPLILAEAGTPIAAKVSTGQRVSGQEYAVGGAVAVLSALGLGGAKALVGGLGKIGGRLAAGGLVLGAGGIFIKETADILPNPNVSVAQKAFSVAMDIAILAGAGVGLRGTARVARDTIVNDAAKAVNEAVKSSGGVVKPVVIEPSAPMTVKVGWAISDAKAAIKDMPQKVYRAFEQAQIDKANKIVQEAIDNEAAKIVGQVGKGEFATAVDAVKYYGTEVKQSVDDAIKRVANDLTDAQTARANGVVQSAIDAQAERIISGVGKGEFATAIDAIKYYSGEVKNNIGDAVRSTFSGLNEAQVEKANKVLQDVVDRESLRIIDSVGKGEFATTIDAIKYYGGEAKRVVSEELSSLRNDLVQAQTEKANKVVQEAIDAQAERILSGVGKGEFATTLDAVRYYSAEIKRSIGDSLKSLQGELTQAQAEKANKIIQDIVDIESERVLGEVGKGDFATVVDALKYYGEEIKRATGEAIKTTSDAVMKGRLEQAQRLIDDAVSQRLVDSIPEQSIAGALREIYKAMQAGDRAKVIAKAKQLEELSAEVEDKGLADQIKARVQDLQKNVNDYMKVTDAIPKEDIAKVSDALGVTHETVKQLYSDLIKETRPLKAEEIGKAVTEGKVAKEVVELASKDYASEMLRQKNLERLMSQEKPATVRDVETYLEAQRVRNENIPKLERASKDLTIQDLQSYLDALKVRVKNLEGLQKQIVDETIGDLETFIKARSTLKGGEIILGEGTIPYKLLPPEQQVLLDAINRDTIRLRELQNMRGGEYEASQIVNRLNENMAKLAKLREQANPVVSFTEALDVKLRELGYTPNEIARMSDMTKVEIVANEIKPPDSGIRGGRPFEKPPEGGGVATKEKVEVKPKTEPMSPEELQKLVEKGEVKPEEKPKTEVKPEEKTATETKTDIAVKVGEAEGSPYQALVWENGKIFVKTIVPIAIPEGFAITEGDAQAFPLTRRIPDYVINPKTGEVIKAKTIEPFVIPIIVPSIAPKIGEEIEAKLQPASQPMPQPQSPQPVPQPTPSPVIFPTPAPIPSPVPQPVPQPEPLPIPEKPYIPEKPVPEKPKPTRRLLLTPKEKSKYEQKVAKIKPGTLAWVQGSPQGGPMWKIWPPPYRKEDSFTMRNAPPGAYKFATGKGSAYKTIQVIGGLPSSDVKGIDLGWAVVDILHKGGGQLEIKYNEGPEANVGPREQTIGMGEGQIPYEGIEKDIAKSRGEVLDGIGERPTDIAQTTTERLQDKGITKSDTPMQLEKTELPQYKIGRVKVFLVNGEYVRDNYLIDFTQGGHDRVYPKFIPPNEIWLDNNLNMVDRKATLLHEITERGQMAKGMDYEEAHNDYANAVESRARHNLRELDTILDEYVRANNGYRPARNARETSLLAAREPIKVGARGYKQEQENESASLPTRTYLGRKLGQSELGSAI